MDAKWSRLAMLGTVLSGCTVLPLLAALPSPAADPVPAAVPATAEQTKFFETSIRPLLADRCQTCHDDKRQLGGLRLDSYAALLKGGVRGPSLVPGQPDKSLLLTAVSYQHKSLKMPPSGKLAAREIADLTRWVQMGAPWPQYGGQGPGVGGQGKPGLPNAKAPHWSFQPVQKVGLPAVKNAAWVKSPIDAFVLAELEKKGLKPAPTADRRTLIRRATFDLTGLPPTPEEVEAFVADRSPNAWSKVIERLLASPAYGERWGRHWLDIARYSDSNGMDENVHYGNAWRYRDYVVNAFNQDKPYDQLIHEQLAGDLMPASDPAVRRERLLATGFLSVGPKVISEVDTTKMIMDMVDEQIDTTARTFMGLTMGCARCHDHKFDPLSTEDYYALAGIFKSTKTMQVLNKPRMWYEHSLATEAELARKAEHDKKIADQKAAIAALVNQANQEVRKAAAPGTTLPKVLEPMFPAGTQAELKRMRGTVAELEKNAPVLPMAMGVTEGEIADVPVHIRGSFLDLGKSVPRRFPVVLAGQQQPALDAKRSGRLELAQWLTRPGHPLTGRVIVNRVWRWHFGQGLVASADNFGRLGDKPTHPELLDWLATVFTSTGTANVAQGRKGAGGRGEGTLVTTPTSGSRGANSPQNWGAGSGSSFILHPSSFAPNTQHPTPNSHGLNWSFKQLHRLLMLSSTYQMSSRYDAAAVKVDPENQLHWRAPVRRLEAEEIRDAVLAVSGDLDQTMGGTLVPLKNREYFFDHTSQERVKYDSKRRSLYLPIVRNHLYDVFQLFDYGDAQIPEGNRPTTTVAPQALFMLNSDLVMESSETLAKALLARTDLDDAARVRVLFQKTHGRPASAQEIGRALALAGKFEAAQKASPTMAAEKRQKAWAWLTHTAIASNEFLFVR